MSEWTQRPPKLKELSRSSILSNSISLGSGATTTIDFSGFQNHKAIQISSLTGTATMTRSLDGVNFVAMTSGGTISSAGIYAISDELRYLKITSSGGGSDAAVGVVMGHI